MSYFRVGITAAVIIWAVLLAGILIWNFAPGENSLGVPTRASMKAGEHLPGSLGQRRLDALLEATRLYRESGADVETGIAEGKEFAPVPFLNRHLEREGAKWRVRSTDGLEAVIYEIS